MASDPEHPFICLWAFCMISLKMFVQFLCQFFNWIVCLPGVGLCEFFMYFGIQTIVLGIIGKYIFPYSWFPFYFLIFSLAMQKLFYFDEAHLFIISFMFLALRDISVKIPLHGISDTFLPLFFCMTSMVSLLLFKYFIHLEFIFVYDVSWWSSFIFLHVAIQIFWHQMVKRLFLIHCIFLLPLSNINWA